MKPKTALLTAIAAIGFATQATAAPLTLAEQGSFAIGYIFSKRFAIIGQYRRVPSRYDNAPAFGVVLQGVEHLFYLVDSLAVPVAPLSSVYGS